MRKKFFLRVSERGEGLAAAAVDLRAGLSMDDVIE